MSAREIENMEAINAELRQWCHELPKVELHAHLNGSIRDSTLLELVNKHGDNGVLISKDVEQMILEKGTSLRKCFELFAVYHVLATDHETVKRITKEAVEDFAADNCIYLELRTTPKKNEAKGMTKRSYMDAVIDGLKAVDTVDVDLCGCELTNKKNGDWRRKKIFVRLLLSINRSEATSAAIETVNLAMEMKDMGVVGIDLSGDPTVGQWDTVLPALEHARKLGLPVTLHCGEVRNSKEIQAMLDFNPQRLGHVCLLAEEDWERLKSLMIPVEICLTSNIMTQTIPLIEYHHFADLYKSKHPLSLCTDDTGLFSTTLSNEYYKAAVTFGLGKEEMFKLAQEAVDFVFANEDVKKHLAQNYEEAKARIL
ncbi:Adenosine deaminase-like protein [Rhynchospora pubera]|uniref:Adenosine deaminase-like protein n=1 Tax=Rhynchospora pubera TaxID=906938 RepID=A0AAV8HH76_9POAL|nr:Adenosine deaminase-like protein [Rhynchospora pubera]